MCQIGGSKFLIYDEQKIHDPLHHIENQMHIFSINTHESTYRNYHLKCITEVARESYDKLEIIVLNEIWLL
jgi:hypothetical protein